MNFVSKIKKYLPDPLYFSYRVGLLHKENLFLSDIERYKKIIWLKSQPYERKCWFADPFIIQIKNGILSILVEEMDRETNLGRLVRLEVDSSDGTIIKRTSILELTTHLSFPFVWKENDCIYIMPENYQSNSLKIWSYDVDNDQLCNPIVLLEGKFLDSQIIKIKDYYYIFTTKYVTGYWDDYKSLYIYRSNNLIGEYSFFQTITNVKNEERGAGQFFKFNDKLIRPAQSCEGGYGKSVIFYEILFEEDGFIEKEVYRMNPINSMRNGLVLHTYNYLDDWSVIDGFDYRCRFVADIYKKVRKIK